MRQRGQASRASFEVIQPTGLMPSGHRPAPSPELSAAATQEWHAVVERMPADYFPRETQGLLATFCSIKVQLDEVNKALAKFGPGLPSGEKRWKRYRELTRMRGACATQLASIATKLRLTPQSRYDREVAQRSVRKRDEQPDVRPWEDDAE